MWCLYISTEDIKIEKGQLLDEGKDISAVESELEELAGLDLDNDLQLQTRVKELYIRLNDLPQRDDYAYIEPSELDRIKAERPTGVRKLSIGLDDEAIYDKLLGAWLGRCSGCLLGKPVEGWKSDRMWNYLKEIGQYPLDDFFITQVPKDIAEKYGVLSEFLHRAFVDKIECMPEDDDTNYTVMGLSLLKNHGKNFTPKDVSIFWMSNVPLMHTATAERVAYRNFVNLIEPPYSAKFCNPYREMIGAQIRADIFGYTALGNPEFAADMAFRDASISHIKNGIYGEMWVASMLAAAVVENDIKRVIEIGLSEIPSRSRLTEAVNQVVDWYDKGIDYEEAITRLHNRWDEYNGHHWCHTVSNAQIVAVGLLWGEKDFGKSICRAVQACFDTDCNGATVGSIIGMILGAKKLPKRWIAPLNDTLMTGISGYSKVEISYLAKETFKLYKEMQDNEYKV